VTDGATSGNKRGEAKTGGRKRGTPNRKTSRVREKLADVEITADRVVEAIRRGAFSDIGELFDRHGNLRPLHELTEAQRFNIAGLEVVIKNAEAGDGHTDSVLKIGGLSEQEVAEVLSISRATVTREWQTARAWLYRRITARSVRTAP
jgi:hypothetical protein